MPTLRTLQRLVESAHDVQSIVRTMKTLAAVNIRQFEAAVDSLAAYDGTVRLGLRILFREHGVPAERGTERPRRRAAIVFGSDQGLCGQFNDEIARYTLERIEERRSDEVDWSLLAVGRRVAERLEERGCVLEPSPPLPGSLSGVGKLVGELLPVLEQWRRERGVARVDVFHNRRTGATAYRPGHFRLLPLDLQWLGRADRDEAPPTTSRCLPLTTMNRDRLFSAVVRQYLFVSLFRSCAESLASENASRIASMQAAEKNVGERLEQLRAAHQQQRQQAITEELLDIVAGYEAQRLTGRSRVRGGGAPRDTPVCDGSELPLGPR